MPEHVKLDRELQLITVLSQGEISIRELEATLKEIIALAESNDIEEVLVDAREMTGSPGVTDLYEFGASLPEQLKFAIVVSVGSRKSSQFLETVAVNRGKRFRVFWHVREALRWLGKGEMRSHGG